LFEERLYTGAAMAANLTDELGLEVGKADVIAPAIGIHLDRVATAVIAAEDDDAEDAGLSHFSEGDLLFAWHVSNFAKNQTELK
jgi:hypothetical protein